MHQIIKNHIDSIRCITIHKGRVQLQLKNPI